MPIALAQPVRDIYGCYGGHRHTPTVDAPTQAPLLPTDALTSGA
jgi:hypothetical protein